MGGSASNSGLSRLVSLRSLPPTRQVPSLPSPSRAASSESLTRHASGTSAVFAALAALAVFVAFEAVFEALAVDADFAVFVVRGVAISSPRSAVAGVVVTHGQRTQIAGVALARCPAPDDQLLLGPDLELEPRVRAPTRLVATPPELGDDAFQPVRPGGLVEGLALGFDMGGEPHAWVIAQHAPQEPLSVLELDVEQEPPIEKQEVEGLVDEAAHARLAELGLEEREIGTPVLVDGHHLAVDDGLPGV